MSEQNLLQMQAMLADMKSAFLGELPERLGLFEQLLLDSTQSDDPIAVTQALCREVHSVKGAAGTHGIPVITSICHHFEDQLQRSSDDYLDHCLRYIDLLRETTETAQNPNPDFTLIESTLHSLRDEFTDCRYHGLVVETSKHIAMIEQNVLQAYPIEVTIVNDGMEALQRLLSEKFDLLITSYEIHSLNGLALISAIRTAETINQNIKSVLITSKQKKVFTRGCKPDKIIYKDANMVDTLTDALEKMLPDLAS